MRWKYICLVGAWALLNYAAGNTLYSLFVVALFLLLSFIIRRHFLYVAVPAMLVMLLSTTVLGTATALIRSNIDTAAAP